ncbi:MAG: ShET2/EspL2 family type III secretion system effector toxin [Pseudomonadota bacterium]
MNLKRVSATKPICAAVFSKRTAFRVRSKWGRISMGFGFCVSRQMPSPLSHALGFCVRQNSRRAFSELIAEGELTLVLQRLQSTAALGGDDYLDAFYALSAVPSQRNNPEQIKQVERALLLHANRCDALPEVLQALRGEQQKKLVILLLKAVLDGYENHHDGENGRPQLAPDSDDFTLFVRQLEQGKSALIQPSFHVSDQILNDPNCAKALRLLLSIAILKKYAESEQDEHFPKSIVKKFNTLYAQINDAEGVGVRRWLPNFNIDIPSGNKTQAAVPYFSEKRNILNLNGKALFLEGDSKGEKIVCRHLTILWLALIKAHKGKVPYAEVFSTTKAIAENMPLEVQEDFRKLIDQSLENYLIENDRFGSLLQKLFLKMESQPESQEGLRTLGLCIISPTHAMGCLLKIKGSGSSRRYVVNFYDPNVTACHSRLSLPDAVFFKTKTLKDFLRRNAVGEGDCYPGERIFHVTVLKDASLAAPYGERTLDAGPLGLTPEYLCFLIVCDHPSVLSKLWTNKGLITSFLPAWDSFSPEEQASVNLNELLNTPLVSGLSVLGLAINFEWQRVVSDFFQALSAALPRLKPEQRNALDLNVLLSAKTPQGNPTLRKRILLGDVGTVQSYFRGLYLFSCMLTRVQKQSIDLNALLVQRNERGAPVLAELVMSNKPEMLSVYLNELRPFLSFAHASMSLRTHALIKLGGSSENTASLLDINALLSGKDADGNSVLIRAMCLGDGRAVQTYLSALFDFFSQLAPEQKQMIDLDGLLRARDRRGISAFRAAAYLVVNARIEEEVLDCYRDALRPFWPESPDRAVSEFGQEFGEISRLNETGLSYADFCHSLDQ